MDLGGFKRGMARFQEENRGRGAMEYMENEGEGRIRLLRSALLSTNTRPSWYLVLQILEYVAELIGPNSFHMYLLLVA